MICLKEMKERKREKTQKLQRFGFGEDERKKELATRN